MLIFSNKERSDLYFMMVKYDNILPEFSDALSKVIQNIYNKNDLLIIYNYMDYEESLDYEDFLKIDEYLGLEIEIMLE